MGVYSGSSGDYVCLLLFLDISKVIEIWHNNIGRWPWCILLSVFKGAIF